MKHKVGQLVINRKLGLGKVLEVRGNLVTVFFKDQEENPRVINTGVVPMELAKEQSDPFFDRAGLPGKRSKRAPARATIRLRNRPDGHA